VRLIVDIYPGKGALGGIYTGLTSADSSYSLVVGCDMPFLNRDLLCYLIEIAPSFDVVVPRIDNMLEPLHAVYSRDCLAPIKEMIDKDRLGISQLFKLVKTRYVDKDEIAKFDPRCLSFFNINTLDDIKKAKDLIE
jgi:molybdopterin-guanine dinucleotide biosynthesis protein A